MARDYEKYSKDALIAHIYELEKQLKNNKYGLYWDKSIEKETVVTQCKTNIPILTREEELCILDNVDADMHILIEGDNFHALTAMNMMCGNEGFVDVIYIDPPYNTGKEDFIYNDRFVDLEDGYRHSKWLQFMKNRLELARAVLKEEGIIFISIDDNEQAQLKMLMDSIFGNRNFISEMIWQKKKGGGNDSRYVANEHEYILFYGKNVEMLDKIFIDYGDEYISRYKEQDETGKFFWDTFKRKSGKQYYPIKCPDGTILEKDENGEPISWLRSETRFFSDLEKGEIKFTKQKNGTWSVHFKQRQPRGYKPRSLMTEHGTTSDGAEEVKKIFNSSSKFDNPKPVELMRYLQKFKFQKDVVILDFFAGSGTTGQAVLELNKEDDGHRKFILCTNNEADICTDVTYQRIKTVISGKRPDDTEYSEGIPANLMYYRTGFIKDSKDTDQAKYCLVEKVDELLCIAEETYIAKERTDKYSHYESLNGKRHTFIYSDYYSEKSFKEFYGLISNVDGEKTVYMFSTDNIIDERLFAGLNGVTVKPIPNKIYEIYREIVEDIKRGEQ